MNRMTMMEKGCDPIAGASRNSYTRSPSIKSDSPSSVTSNSPMSSSSASSASQRRATMSAGSSTGRRPSFIAQMRELISHPRTGSLGASMFRRPPSSSSSSSDTTRRVQVAECSVEGAYDLRDKEANFYDDDQAFRRPRSNSSDLLILRKTSRPISFNVVGVIDQKNDPYRQYMSLVDVYELCPNNSKIIIIDASMPATSAFRIMRDQNITTLIVWDTSNPRSTRRILTLTDCLLSIRNEPKPANDDGVLRASDILSESSLVSVSISSKILDLCEELHQNRLHRVVVLDDAKEVVHIISVRRVLAAIHKQNRSLHFAQWLSKPIGMSACGTWDAVACVSRNETVYRAMEDMLGFHYTTLPVLDSQKNVIGVITKTDICKALPIGSYDPKRWLLETRISDIMHICKSHVFVTSSDSIGQVLDTLLCSDAQTAFAIDDRKVIGAISLTDFLSFILRSPLAPTDEEQTTCDAEPHDLSSALPTPESTSSSTEKLTQMLHKL